MSKWQFTAPGGLQDFADPQKWHQAMVREATGIVDILVEAVLNRHWRDDAEYQQVAATLAYANPVVTAPPPGAVTVGLTPWGAFPRAVTVQAPWQQYPPDGDDPDGSFRAAEDFGHEDQGAGQFEDGAGNPLDLPVRHRQDEYCEWTVRKNADGKITKAIFVAEGYDYFSELFDTDEKTVVEIYKNFTETYQLTADDLRATNGIYFRRTGDHKRSEVVKPGRFNHRNRYNREPGIVHLSHRANSLGAEVNLAGVSGIARVIASGDLLDGVDERRLLCCSHGGNPNRNSDPLISKQAYAQVLAGKHYTLANPVGLYITAIAHERLLLPDMTPAPQEWWRTVRGNAQEERILRLELEVPAGENFVLGDLLVDGTPLKYGGQLATLLSVHLFVTLWDRLGGGHGPAVGCEATCCVKNGTDILVPSSGQCGSGFSLKYPGLLPDAALAQIEKSLPFQPLEAQHHR